MIQNDYQHGFEHEKEDSHFIDSHFSADTNPYIGKTDPRDRDHPHRHHRHWFWRLLGLD